MSDSVSMRALPSRPVADWAATALPADWKPRRIGVSSGLPGISVRLQTGTGIVALMARAGQATALSACVQELFTVELPAGPACVGDGPIRIVGAGPGKWFALRAQAADGAEIKSWAANLAARLDNFASIIELSHAYTLFQLDGPRSRDLLAKGVNVDLDPTQFAIGAAATTPIGLIGATLWRGVGSNLFHIAVPRSFTAAFCHWLSAGGAEFGLEVETPTASWD